MNDQVIQTRRGLYGRLNITLPLSLKTTMLGWQKRSGMKKAEFLRLVLTTGFLALCKGLPAAEVNRLLTDAEGDPSSRHEEDGQPAGGAQECPFLVLDENGRPGPVAGPGLS